MRTKEEMKAAIERSARNGARIMVHGKGQAENITADAGPKLIEAVIRHTLIPARKRIVAELREDVEYYSGMLELNPNLTFEGRPIDIKGYREALAEAETELSVALSMIGLSG